MNTIPATDLRSNVATLAVSNLQLPAVGRSMNEALPVEVFDPKFQGQQLETTYFDTTRFALRKARVGKGKYLTLRVRCYQPSDTYALSVKTENQKFRRALDVKRAESLLGGGSSVADFRGLLPPDLLARLLDLVNEDSLLPVVSVSFTRYAVEDARDRLTLDCGVVTDTGKTFPGNVLEHKTSRSAPEAFPQIDALCLRPIRLSKFLWATSFGVR